MRKKEQMKESKKEKATEENAGSISFGASLPQGQWAEKYPDSVLTEMYSWEGEPGKSRLYWMCVLDFKNGTKDGLGTHEDPVNSDGLVNFLMRDARKFMEENEEDTKKHKK